MSKSREPSPLAVAAAAFEAELEAYRRAGELFVKTPLDSVKHLERANTTLAEVAAAEERLQAAAQALVGALGTARAHQEALAQTVIAHVPTVQAKNAVLQQRMGEMAALAGAVGDLNVKLAAASADANAERAHEVAALVGEMSARAEALAKAAHDDALDEIATQAHALHQKLAAIARKLAGTTATA